MNECFHSKLLKVGKYGNYEIINDTSISAYRIILSECENSQTIENNFN